VSVDVVKPSTFFLFVFHSNLLKTGYGSRMVNPVLSVSTIKKSSFNLLRVEEELSAAHLHLARCILKICPMRR
jgi:DNA adenine methylase